MRKNTLMSSLFLFLGIFITQAFCHTHTGECGYLYTDFNKGGNSYKVCHAGNCPAGFNNNISSIYVPHGFNMRLFKDSGEKGQWMDIAAGVWNANTEYNKVISSVLYNNWGACSTFYSGVGQTGKSFLCCQTGFLVPGYNDQISSVYIAPGHFFRFFTGDDQTGDWYDVRGRWNLKAEFVNNVKSFKLQHWATCSFTWFGANRTGKMFMICDSASSMPTGYDNKINYIEVPTNMTMTIYQGANYTGTSITLKEGTKWTAPANWKNTLSSLKVTITGGMD